MWSTQQIPADLVTFTEETLTGKLHFLSSVSCFNLFLLVKTTRGNANGANCVFPFTYRNRKYSQCIPFGGRKWCATVPNYDENATWGYCLPTGKAVFVNWLFNSISNQFLIFSECFVWNICSGNLAGFQQRCNQLYIHTFLYSKLIRITVHLVFFTRNQFISN